MPDLPAHLHKLVDAPYPAFLRRRDGAAARGDRSLAGAADCDHLVFCGANRFGSAVQWLTQWPVTAEAVGVFTPGERDALFVQYVNHAPQARLLADQADVAWGGEVLDRGGAGRAGEARRARRPRRRDRPADRRAARVR